MTVGGHDDVDVSKAQENIADTLLQSKTFNSDLAPEPRSIFTVEKGLDGKIIPPPQQKAEDN